ncbi:glycosyltransferase family 39 protein [soil metagenome]
MPVLGAAAGGLSLVGAGTPSYWGDEAASVMSALRPLPSLVGELSRIDAVHGLYYLFLHFWVGLVGTSEFAVRAPSAVAAGVAVAGTGVLGSRLIGRTGGIVAALVLAVLPEMTRMAIEARSYAFAVAAGVWLTVLLLRLATRESRRVWWIAYGVGAALCVYLFLYLALLLVVHTVIMLVLRPPRASVRRWLLALAVALVLATPMVLIALHQQGQISFLARRDYATVRSVIVRQWFRTPLMAFVGWTLILGGAAVSVLRRRSVPRSINRGAVIALAWVVLPTAVLVAGNDWVHPMYNLRYPAFCLPGVAIAMAIGILHAARFARDAGARRLVGFSLLIAVAGAAAPSFIAQRGLYAKDGGSDLRQIAAAVRSHAEPGSGAAIVFDQTTKPSRRPRLALDLYPNSFTAVADVALLASSVDRTRLWDQVAPLTSIEGRVTNYQTIWAVEARGSTSTDLDVLRSLGYVVSETIHVHRTTLYELEKEPS